MPSAVVYACSRANCASRAEDVLAPAISLQHHLLGELTAHPYGHLQGGLDQIGVQVLVDGPADHLS